jgi:hypothetical protein
MAVLTDEYAIRYVLALRSESEMAKKNRMDLNRDNYAMYQLQHDFSHKMKGQSKEVLSKTRNATESSKAFFQQALADLGDWYRVTARDGSDGKGMLVKPEEMQKLMNYMLGRANYFSHVGNSTQSGLLGSLAISRVYGAMIPKPKFTAKKEGKGSRYKVNVMVSDDETWELRFKDIRQEDYYPDSTGDNLFEIDECLMDLHTLKKITKDDPDYDKTAINGLRPWANSDLGEEDRARETGQNVSHAQMRPRVKVTNFYGTIVDQETGDILCENCVLTIANDDTVIRMAVSNPMWHQKNDIVAAALIEVTQSVWGIAMMDAGTKHNHSLIELFNLMLDSAMKAVWGVNQIRTDVLTDPTQITDGIRWGTNLQVNAALPVGGKVMEPVLTGEIPPEVITMFNLLSQETLTSMKTNDLRMGAQSMRAVKATEVVAAENSITSEFQGIAKNFEEKKIQPELELACWTICQNWDLIDSEVFVSLFDRDRGEALAALKPQEVFVNTVNGLKFEVFGISLTLRRQADFRKWTTLLQTVGASPVLTEAFLQEGYTFGKLLGEIMTAIDINKSKIKGSEAALPPAGPQGPGTMEQPGGAPGASPDMMSQVPAAANVPQGGLAAAFGSAGGMNMPSSQAIR